MMSSVPVIVIILEWGNDVGRPGLFQDKFEEAELMSRRALAITKSTMGVDHPSLSEKLGNLGSLLYKQVGEHAASWTTAAPYR